MSLVLTSDPSPTISIQSKPISTWVKHPNKPEMNLATIDKKDGTHTRSVVQGHFTVLGGTAQIVVSDSVRQLSTGQVQLYVKNRVELDALVALFSTGETILIQYKPSPSETGYNLYAQIGADVKMDRASPTLAGTDWYVTATYYEQERP